MPGERHSHVHDGVDTLLWADCPEEIYLQRVLQQSELEGVCDVEGTNTSFPRRLEVATQPSSGYEIFDIAPFDLAMPSLDGDNEVAPTDETYSSLNEESVQRSLATHDAETRSSYGGDNRAGSTSTFEWDTAPSLDLDPMAGSLPTRGCVINPTSRGSVARRQEGEVVEEKQDESVIFIYGVEPLAAPEPISSLRFVSEASIPDVVVLVDGSNLECGLGDRTLLSTLSSEPPPEVFRMQQSEQGSRYPEAGRLRVLPRTPDLQHKTYHKVVPNTPETEITHCILIVGDAHEQDVGGRSYCGFLKRAMEEKAFFRRLLCLALFLFTLFIFLAVAAFILKQFSLPDEQTQHASNSREGLDSGSPAVQNPSFDHSIPARSPALEQPTILENNGQPSNTIASGINLGTYSPTSSQDTTAPYDEARQSSPPDSGEPSFAPSMFVNSITRAPTASPIESVIGAPTSLLLNGVTSAPTASLIENFQAFIIQVSPESQAAIFQKASPQYEAMTWILRDPLYQTYSRQKLVQRWVLATHYYSTNGSNWLHSDNWLTGLDECSWFTTSTDAVCDGAGNVARLELHANNLAGTIIPELSLLSNSLGRRKR